MITTRKNYDISHMIGGEDIVAAERENGNVLILRKLSVPVRRVDDELADYQLQYLWLAHPTADLTRVQGADISYWTAEEYDRGKGLFEQSQLFPNPVRDLEDNEAFVMGSLLEGPKSKTAIVKDLKGIGTKSVEKALRSLKKDRLIRKRGTDFVLTAQGAISEHRWRERALLQPSLEVELAEEFGRVANACQVHSTAAKLLAANRGDPGAAKAAAAARASGARSKNLGKFWNKVEKTLDVRQPNLSPQAQAAVGGALGSGAGSFFGSILGMATAASAGGAAVPLGGLLGFVIGSTGGGALGASAAAPAGYKRGGAKGAALGGLLGPLGAAGGAYIGSQTRDRRSNALKKRLIRR